MSKESSLLVDCGVDGKFSSLKSLFVRPSKFAQEIFEPGPENLEAIKEARVLVVGAGGLGCEILKDLALSGFTDIHVVDLDTIDVSNLNRQFLFRQKDVDKPKAEVAAEFIMKRIKGVKVTPHKADLTTFPLKWWKKYNIVISGLDNIEARRHVNRQLVELTKFDENGEIDQSTIIPLIDGGTEAFSGQTRIFIPRITACFECTLASLTPQVGFQSCTIRNIPRLPEHCITYALKVLWPKLQSFRSHTDYDMLQDTKNNNNNNNNEGKEEKHGEEGEEEDDDDKLGMVKLDKDNMEHMLWLYQRSEERANQFGIKGVSFSLTLQVVKNIIPAIASTNALISAACVNEAFKYLSFGCRNLNNYYMYFGAVQTGISTQTFLYQRNPDCDVCQAPHFQSLSEDDSNNMKLNQLFTRLEKELSLHHPSYVSESGVLYQPLFHSQYAANLEKTLTECGLGNGSEIIANDKQKKTKRIILKIL